MSRSSLLIWPCLAVSFAILLAACAIHDDPIRWRLSREVAFPISHLDPPAGALRLTARIETNRKGEITSISIRDMDANADTKPLGGDISKLNSELQSRWNDRRGRPVKWILEIDGNLPHARVVEMLDLATAAGFEDVVPQMPEERIAVGVMQGN